MALSTTPTEALDLVPIATITLAGAEIVSFDPASERAFVTSGWANQGVDVFKLSPGKAPTYDQFIRTRGWWSTSLARQDDTVLLASGYWGTQVVNLK